MELPAKRPRLGPSRFQQVEDDNDDELFHDPEELNAKRDPAIQLEMSRAVATFKLKTSWESIFEKYGKDFTGVGDEIDLRTGEVVVDNGHLRSLEDAEEPKSSAVSEAGSVDEEERILHGTRATQIYQSITKPLMPLAPYNYRFRGLQSYFSGPPRLSTIVFPPPFQPPNPSTHLGFDTLRDNTIDQAWRTPELPSVSSHDHLGTGPPGTPERRRVSMRSLPGLQDEDADEDDILLRSFCSPFNASEGHFVSKTQPPLEMETSSSRSSRVPDERLSVLTAGSKTNMTTNVKSSDKAVPRGRLKEKPEVVILQDGPTSRTPKDATLPLSPGARPEQMFLNSAERPLKKMATFQVMFAHPQRRSRQSQKAQRDMTVSSESRTRPSRDRKEIVRFSDMQFPTRKSSNASVKMSEKNVRAFQSQVSVVRKEATVLARLRRTSRIAGSTSAGDERIGLAKSGDDAVCERRSRCSSKSVRQISAPSQGKETRAVEPSKSPSFNTLNASISLSDNDGVSTLDRNLMEVSRDVGKARWTSLEPAVDQGGVAETSMTTVVSPTTQPPSRRVVKRSLSSEPSKGKTVHRKTHSTGRHSTTGTSSLPGTSKEESQLLENLRRAPADQGQLPSDCPPRASYAAGLVSTTGLDPLADRERKTPATPHQRPRRFATGSIPNSSSKLSIVSLVSDDEDEISVYYANLPSAASRRHLRRSGGQAATTSVPARRSSTWSAASRLKLGLSPKKSRPWSPTTSSVKTTPSQSSDSQLIHTPGGTRRRCGENGFKCDRDFCFACL